MVIIGVEGVVQGELSKAAIFPGGNNVLDGNSPGAIVCLVIIGAEELSMENGPTRHL